MWHYATDMKVNMHQTIQIYAMLITTTILNILITSGSI